MKARDFCYWLQGLFELQDPASLTEAQTRLIKAHLNMVFTHEIDPSFPTEQQSALDAAHAAGKTTITKPAPAKAKPNNGFFKLVTDDELEHSRC